MLWWDVNSSERYTMLLVWQQKPYLLQTHSTKNTKTISKWNVHQFWDLPLKRTIFQGTLFPHFYNFLDKHSCSILLFSQNFWNLQSNVHILEKSWIFSKKIDCSLTGCTNCPRFAPIYECMYKMNSVDSQKLTCIKQQWTDDKLLLIAFSCNCIHF